MSSLILEAREIGKLAWSNGIRFSYLSPFTEDMVYDTGSVYRVCALRSLSPIGAFVLAIVHRKHEKGELAEHHLRRVDSSLLITEIFNSEEFHVALAFYAAVVRSLFASRIPVPHHRKGSAQEGLQWVVETSLLMSPVLSMEVHLSLFTLAHAFACFYAFQSKPENETDLSNHVCLGVFLDLCEDLHIDVSSEVSKL